MIEQILQIIPTPPNSSDGIGDYALLLATQLLQDFQVDTQFLVFRNDIEVVPVVNGFSMAQLPSHQPEIFCSCIPTNIRVIIVHFSGYPYFNTSLKGIFGADTPFWFIDALQAVIKNHQLKLIVMFHELPKLHWKQFYLFDFLNPIQSIVSRRLARMADTVLTSSTKYQAILSEWLGRKVIRIFIFSNMGEPPSITPLVARQRRLIIFGGSARSRIYQNHFKVLIQSCKLLEIKEIYDVGPPLKLPKLPSSEINLVERGYCSQTEISQLMMTSLAGCLDYSPFPGNLGKSGAFAAYCAHGILPILTRYNPSETNGLCMNQHYLVLGSKLDKSSLDRTQIIANKAYEWYQDHTLKEIAKIFHSYI